MNNEYHSFASFPERLQCLLQETFIQRVRFSFLSASLTKKFSMLSLSLSLSLSLCGRPVVYTIQLYNCGVAHSMPQFSIKEYLLYLELAKQWHVIRIRVLDLDRVEVWR
jgi:hypothetical protein